MSVGHFYCTRTDCACEVCFCQKCARSRLASHVHWWNVALEKALACVIGGDIERTKERIRALKEPGGGGVQAGRADLAMQTERLRYQEQRIGEFGNGAGESPLRREEQGDPMSNVTFDVSPELAEAIHRHAARLGVPPEQVLERAVAWFSALAKWKAEGVGLCVVKEGLHLPVTP